MRPFIRQPRAVLAGLAAASALAGTAQAQPFSVPWYTIDSGGGTSTGGTFTLRGTIGQPDAAAPLSGGAFNVYPGFWPGAISAPPCPGDLNGDGILDLGDIQAFVALFLVQDLAVDFNADGIVDLGDIQVFVAIFLAGC